VLALLICAGFVTGSVAAAPAPTAQTHTVVLHELVPKAGRYRVTLRLASSSRREQPVRLHIGQRSRRIELDQQRSSLTMVLSLPARTLTVRAVGLRSRPRVSISLRLVGKRAPARPPAPIGDHGSWKLIFDDEFNGSHLNTRRWSTGWFGTGITGPLGSGDLECFDPTQVTVGGGKLSVSLVAKPESCSGATRPYASGIVTTDGKFQFTYGVTEVRAWMPGSGGVIADWPDIWTDGQNWPTDGEDDIMEGLRGQACWHFHYTDGNAPGNCASGSFTGGWHTFAGDWEPGIVTYYYDGKAVGTITHGITTAPMYLLVSLGADNTYGGPVAAGRIRVDYVRVWQH
jgi:hypothetical protein